MYTCRTSFVFRTSTYSVTTYNCIVCWHWYCWSNTQVHIQKRYTCTCTCMYTYTYTCTCTVHVHTHSSLSSPSLYKHAVVSDRQCVRSAERDTATPRAEPSFTEEYYGNEEKTPNVHVHVRRGKGRVDRKVGERGRRKKGTCTVYPARLLYRIHQKNIHTIT